MILNGWNENVSAIIFLSHKAVYILFEDKLSNFCQIASSIVSLCQAHIIHCVHQHHFCIYEKSILMDIRIFLKLFYHNIYSQLILFLYILYPMYLSPPNSLIVQIFKILAFINWIYEKWCLSNLLQIETVCFNAKKHFCFMHFKFTNS